MENRNQSGSTTVTPLGTMSNSRMNISANHTPSTGTPDNSNPQPWDMVPPRQQVMDFFRRRPRDEIDTVKALRNPFHGFVTALLDFLEPGLRLVRIVKWTSPLIKTLVCDFGWDIAHVWTCDDEGEFVDIEIKRPSRPDEERARTRTQARRARGITESPLPRTYFENQMHFFMEYADEEMIAYFLSNATVPLALQVLLARLRPLYGVGFVPFSSPVVQVLLDKFDWCISSEDVCANESNEGQARMVRIKPPPKPEKRRRLTATRPGQADRVPLGALRAS